jgi:predicted Zn-dependent peptidase
MSSNFGIAMTLVENQLLFGDWKLFRTYRELIAAVTAADVMDFAKTYLTPENRTVAYLVKKAKAS